MNSKYYINIYKTERHWKASFLIKLKADALLWFLPWSDYNQTGSKPRSLIQRVWDCLVFFFLNYHNTLLSWTSQSLSLLSFLSWQAWHRMLLAKKIKLPFKQNIKWNKECLSPKQFLLWDLLIIVYFLDIIRNFIFSFTKVYQIKHGQF